MRLFFTLLILTITISSLNSMDFGSGDEAEEIWRLRLVALTGVMSHGVSARLKEYRPIRTIEVPASELAKAIKGFACGDEVRVLAGTVMNSLSFTQSCAEGAPLVVKARIPKSVKLESKVEISGSGIALSGFELVGGQIFITGRGRNRISGMLFRNSISQSIWIDKSAHNEIAYNEFVNFTNHAVTISLDAANSLKSAGNWLHHNYVHDIAIGDAAQNGKEAFRVLTDAFSKSFTVIENNLLENVFHPGEPEAISIKSSRVVVWGNTLVDSGAAISMPAPYDPSGEWTSVNVTNRNGIGNVYAFNHFVRKGARGVGLEIFGEKNIVFRNSFHGGDLFLQSGSTSETARCSVPYDLAAPCILREGAATVAHVAASKTMVISNRFLSMDGSTGSLYVGSNYWRTEHAPGPVFPASRTLLKYNNVKAEIIRGENIQETFSANATGATSPRLTPESVGLNAAPDDYK